MFCICSAGLSLEEQKNDEVEFLEGKYTASSVSERFRARNPLEQQIRGRPIASNRLCPRVAIPASSTYRRLMKNRKEFCNCCD